MKNFFLQNIHLLLFKNDLKVAFCFYVHTAFLSELSYSFHMKVEERKVNKKIFEKLILKNRDLLYKFL